jgi:S1-C subfamily serine protease
MKLSLCRKLWLLSPIPALAINLLLLAPPQTAAQEFTPLPGERLVSTTASGEEDENVLVYQKNAPAVVSINSGRNQGAGAIITSDGLVVTNRHVIQGASVVSLKTANGQSYKAQLISYEGFNKDLAFLRIVSRNAAFPYIRMGDSSQVRVGQRVLAIGSPFGLDGTLTTGIISRIDRERNMIQTDAAINPGNSGGPLLNTHGDLIGINRSIINPVGASSAGISFAVPVNTVKQEVASIRGSSVALYNR